MESLAHQTQSVKLGMIDGDIHILILRAIIDADDMVAGREMHLDGIAPSMLIPVVAATLREHEKSLTVTVERDCAYRTLILGVDRAMERASIRARLSSIPGSQSIITRLFIIIALSFLLYEIRRKPYLTIQRLTRHTCSRKVCAIKNAASA